MASPEIDLIENEARHLAALIEQMTALRAELEAASDRLARLALLGSALERDAHGDRFDG